MNPFSEYNVTLQDPRYILGSPEYSITLQYQQVLSIPTDFLNISYVPVNIYPHKCPLCTVQLSTYNLYHTPLEISHESQYIYILTRAIPIYSVNPTLQGPPKHLLNIPIIPQYIYKYI